jgi:ABC-type transport system involved in multi-copper enzyme maturation permease subunit
VLRTLIAKEIAETALGLRFIATTLLCLLLIPLGMYVGREDYEQRFAGYQEKHQAYRERHGTPEPPVNGQEEAQGFRPPSVLSIFASGLDPFVPDTVITSSTGLFRTVKEPDIDNPQSLLFGKLDWLSSITLIVSLMVLILTYDAISGEKEKGTLRLIIANSVPRHRILLCKIVGKYVAFLVPFGISTLIALLILEASPLISITSSRVGPILLVILGVTLLFVLSMVCLGVCISTFTRHSMGSIMLLFLAWALFVLGVPRACPILAEIIHPLQDSAGIDFTKRTAREDIVRPFQQSNKAVDTQQRAERAALMREEGQKREEIAARVRQAGREPTDADFVEGLQDINNRFQANRTKYSELAAQLARECNARIAEELGRIEQDHQNKRNAQSAVAMNLCRISPVSCYAYIVSGLTGTGVAEPDNFFRNAQRFQNQVEDVFYDQLTWGLGVWKRDAGFDRFDPPPFPDMEYGYPTLAENIQTVWPDVLLLGLFSVFFGTLTFVRFSKYDVR